MATRIVATAFAFTVVGMMMMSMPSFSVSAEDCGWQAGGVVCAGGMCCSEWGWCGITPDHCNERCQSQCGGSTPTPPPPPPPPPPSSPTPTPGGEGVASIISEDIFDELLMQHRDYAVCTGKRFFTYEAFIAAANAFPDFGTTGDLDTRKRELAAFLGQTSHETTGGWDGAPGGRYSWGYCFKEEVGAIHNDYCQDSPIWPCVSGKQYYGRGPIQLSWNYNYGPAGSAIGFDGLNNPDIVANDATISFKTAIWFWMTPQSPKPSCHDVMTGIWSPSESDIAANRTAGYGMVTNIINGGLECGQGSVDSRQEDRIGFYTTYCDSLGVGYGLNLDCSNQRPFGFAVQSRPGLIKTAVV